MVIKQHKVTAEIWLKSIWYRDPPVVSIRLGSNKIFHGDLLHDKMFMIDQYIDSGESSLAIKFHNKSPQDTVIEKNLDKAVIIDRIAFNKVESPQFVWQGSYTPEYHPEWYQQQITQGLVPEPVLKYHNYLGWNGEWKLTFSVPIFTWIHQIQNLGWIYD